MENLVTPYPLIFNNTHNITWPTAKKINWILQRWSEYSCSYKNTAQLCLSLWESKSQKIVQCTCESGLVFVYDILQLRCRSLAQRHGGSQHDNVLSTSFDRVAVCPTTPQHEKIKEFYISAWPWSVAASESYVRKGPLTLTDFTCFTQSWRLWHSSQEPENRKFHLQDSKFRVGKYDLTSGPSPVWPFQLYSVWEFRSDIILN